MVIVPVGWILFALEYTGHEEWITRKNIALLSLIPAITVIMVVTNSLHHLFYTTVSEVVIGGLSFHIVTYGPAFWLHSIYSYTLIFATLLLIFQRFLFTSPIYRAQVTTILIATLLPLVLNLMLVSRIGSFELVDPTPFALLFAGLVILFSMARFQLLDITPIALEKILDEMVDGILVIDARSRIIRLNGAACRYLGIDDESSISKAIDTTLPDSALECIRNSCTDSESGHLHSMTREISGMTRYFEIRSIPLQRHANEVKGQMILIRDITLRKQAEVALSEARKKITFLSGLTRHDILNQVTGLLLHIDIARTMETDPEVHEWLNKQEESILNIQHQIQAAKDYEDLGVNPPQWVDLGRIMNQLRPVFDARKISLEMPEGTIELFADPLLERVFSNLVNDSIRHGGHVTTIRIRYEIADTLLSLIYEDNGVGIPTHEKKLIFERRAGNHIGIGLFLGAEILKITGITIQECGEPGHGVQFRITVPSQKYRIRT
jgi:PAS domain S-box-containing protein